MQTAGVKRERLEKFGLESVPRELQRTPWYRFAFIQIAISANAGNFLVPALAVIQGELSFIAAILATCLGAWVGFAFVSILSLPGARLGLPAQYVIRSMLGVQGARYLSSPIRSLTSLYWFSVQTIGGTVVLQQLIVRATGEQIPFLLLSIPFSIIMVMLALVGFEAVKRATTYFLPMLLAGEMIMLYIYFTTNSGDRSLLMLSSETSHGSFSMMLFYASLAFVQYVSGVSASADMTRYARTPKEGAWGLFIGNALGFTLTAVIGCASAYLFHELNPFVSSSAQVQSPLIIGIITLTAVISMISINISNAYTGGYSLLNTFPRLSRIQSAVLFGALGVCFSSIPALVYEAEVFISMLGGFVIPISAVICADYIFIKKMKLDETALIHLTKARSINAVAILSIGIGAVLYFLIPGGWSPGFIAFVLTFSLYTWIKLIEQRRT
ncbi:purine-cytosine permease family protein [Thalassobacillus hwangdonensis]|uniref:Purine-cytosine permease family protein n=1 Tax=Thalassobacillus hwangdonensis TaxID=546108 RepID=A0ABW3KYT5_9BACI